MNKRAGGRPGDYWCMSTIVFTEDSAAREAGRKPRLSRTPSVSAQLKYANAIGSGLLVIPPQFGQKGDIFCQKSGGGDQRDIGRLWPGHTGWIDGRDGAQTPKIVYDTEEGNTNKAGSRNGIGIFPRKRKSSEILAIIRIPE